MWTSIIFVWPAKLFVCVCVFAEEMEPREGSMITQIFWTLVSHISAAYVSATDVVCVDQLSECCWQVHRVRQRHYMSRCFTAQTSGIQTSTVQHTDSCQFLFSTQFWRRQWHFCCWLWVLWSGNHDLLITDDCTEDSKLQFSPSTGTITHSERVSTTTICSCLWVLSNAFRRLETVR